MKSTYNSAKQGHLSSANQGHSSSAKQASCGPAPQGRPDLVRPVFQAALVCHPLSLHPKSRRLQMSARRTDLHRPQEVIRFDAVVT